MDTTAPTPWTYEGDGIMRAPSALWAQRSDKRFVVGMTYRFVEEEDRSRASHNHQFAGIEDRWHSLPDHLALQFANPDDLRKHALIMTGWHHERRLATSSSEEARKVAAFMMNGKREYALISVAGNVIVERTARSQKQRGPERMNKADFQKSKQDVLDWIDDLLRVERPSPSIAPHQPERQLEAAE